MSFGINNSALLGYQKWRQQRQLVMPEVSHIEPGPDTFTILLTTDNHVGYMENDQIRGDDSWKTFEEILSIGRDHDVDMIVQGGDLFHVNAPTKKSYYYVMKALREHCWCDKPIEYKLVSDPSDAMATKHFVYPAEYDMNVNVGMPLYAISGNHDDATGEELLSPLDILSVSGLLNHFGRVIDNEQIRVCPLLFNKGRTNLALYGLHSVREERLMKTIASGNLEFLEPDTVDENVQWFNLMCIHQNHVHRPGVKVVEETCLPTFLDFVLWGHEHDCKPVAIKNEITGAHILQAGSSIATSLSEGETLEKHVYILSVKGKDFSLKPVRLRTVRPFVMKDVVLSKTGLSATSSNKNEVLNFLMMQVELMIEKANSIWKKNNIQDFNDGKLTDRDIPLPLIRLRVEYSGGYEVENPRFFSNRFVGKVANINDVVLFYKKKKYQNNGGNKLLVSKDEMTDDDEDMDFDFDFDQKKDGEGDILGMIKENIDDKDLIMLTKKKVTEALGTLLKHDEDKNILNTFVKTEEEDHIQMLDRLSLENDDDIESLIVTGDVKDVKKSFRELAKRIKAETQVAETAEEAPSQVRQAAGPIMFNGGVSGNPNNSILATSTQDRVRASTPTQRAGNGNNRPRKKVKSTEVVVESDSDSDINIDGISDKQKENTNKHGGTEDIIEAPNALFDISMPSSLAPSAVKQRVRGRAGGRAAPRSRVGARANSNANANTNTNANESHSTQSQLSIMDALLRKK